MKIRSGYWSESGVFFYATSSHLKYALITSLSRDSMSKGAMDSSSAEVGVVMSLERPIWLVKVITQGDFSGVFYFDSEMRLGTFKVDNAEYEFKLALDRRDYGRVFDMIRHNRLLGQAIIAYLRRKGYPEVQNANSRWHCSLLKTLRHGSSLQLSVEIWRLRWKLQRRLTARKTGCGLQRKRWQSETIKYEGLIGLGGRAWLSTGEKVNQVKCVDTTS